MAIHYFPEINRFRDDSGKFVSESKALKSSTARKEYNTFIREFEQYIAETEPKEKKPKRKTKPKIQELELEEIEKALGIISEDIHMNIKKDRSVKNYLDYLIQEYDEAILNQQTSP